ncbi:MAG: DUF2298 domain-containing protein [Chloroflexota bacterium]
MLFGLMLGFGISSKISVAPLALILVVAVSLRVWEEIGPVEPDQNATPEPPSRKLSALLRSPIARAAIGLAIAGVVTILTFRIWQPYAFLPPGSGVAIEPGASPALRLLATVTDPIGFQFNPSWLAQMKEVKLQVSGFSDIPPNHQWGHRLPLVFPWVNMVRVGMGWPLGIACWLGFLWALWEIGRRHRGAGRLILPVIWIGLYFTWQGVGWVTTMRYFLPVYPFLILLGAWAIMLLWDRVQALVATRGTGRWRWPVLLSGGLGVLVVLSAYGWGFAVSRIYTRPVTRVAATSWMLENIPSDVTLVFDTPDGPRRYQLGLPNNWTPPGQPEEDDPRQPSVSYTLLGGGIDNTFRFTVPFDGTLRAIRLNHIAAPGSPLSDDATLNVRLMEGSDENHVLVERTLSGRFDAPDGERGGSYEIMTSPQTLTQNTAYFLKLTPSTPLISSGATLATEGAWDDPVPLSTAPYNIWGGQYQGYELQIHWEDVEDKRARMQYVLDHSDYIAISSNRFYDSMRRNPQRYPLTIADYRALFGGELGFEMIADFTSRPNLGPIQFHDDNAEEAWTVYDHPRVMIFQKTDAYSPEQTAAILGAVNLDTVVRVIAKDAAGPPARIKVPSGVTAPSADSVTSGGTGGNGRFFVRFQPLTVLIWWLLISAIGWATFPTLFTLLPGLPDRGYPLSRIFGLLFGAWLSWLVSSLTPLPWTGWVVLAALVTLTAISALLIIPRREEFIEWLRANLRHLLLIEIIALALFLLFVLIRLGNPDLWHPAYGGEKPMDLAYFNAVLHSRTFPPYDPWFAGGTINYYYFGFVLVGAPLKLIGIPTTLAYNIILPTLFSLTGIGAFSAAFNLVAPPGADQVGHDHAPEPGESRPTLLGLLRGWPNIHIDDLWNLLDRRREASTAYRQAVFAGLAALLMSVLLGNLDQIRTILWGLAELGSGSPAYPFEMVPRLSDTLRGLGMTISQGAILPVGLGEWYWNATRLIPVPINDAGVLTEIGPITEFPYFTFLYADLHAHMNALPLTLLALSWSISMARGASTRRPPALALLNGFLGALAIGALRPTNTWDWPTYLLIGMAATILATAYRRGDMKAVRALGLGAVPGVVIGGATYLFLSTGSNASATPSLWPIVAAAVIGGLAGLVGFGTGVSVLRDPADLSDPSQATPPPSSMTHWGTLLIGSAQAGLLALGTMALFLPFILNYKLEYTAFIPWTGSHTPLWAYVDILGLFLFIIISWIVWEAWRWNQSQREQGGRLSRAHLLPVFAGVLLMLGAVVLIASSGYPIALIALPLLASGILLFIRREQPIEKRMVLGLMCLALLLSAVVEVVVLQGDLGRMNTVFKFYLQVWMLLAIVAGVALSWLWPAISQAPGSIRLPWMVALGALLFLSVLYPLTATQAKVADRWAPDTPTTLDGMAYMQYAVRGENGAVFSLAPDYYAIRWLQDNIKGTPVILEAQTVEYLWGSRVSVYTGLPTVLGWNWHQRQQRPDLDSEIWARAATIPEIYNTPDIERARTLLDRYGVDLIMVGELERAYYQPLGLAKFNDMVDQGYLSVLYARDNTIIYRVNRQAETS